jgi:hypothetical protein
MPERQCSTEPMRPQGSYGERIGSLGQAEAHACSAGVDPGADLVKIFPEGRAEKVLEAANTGDFEMIGRV